MRYIDADEVKKAIEESWDGCLGAYDSNEIVMNDLWVIDKVPTADVVDKKDLDKITEAHEKIGYEKGYRDGYAQAIEDAEIGERKEDGKVH